MKEFWIILFAIVGCVAVDLSQYSRSQQLHSSVKLYWTIDTASTTIKLALQANATGWVGFGIAEAGAMQGADIVYYEAAGNKLVDSYSLDFEAPIVDTKQDWTLVSGSSAAGVITVEATRALDTRDPQDAKFSDDSWPAIDATRFIIAFGDSPKISYHGALNRAYGQVRFFTPPATDPLAAIKADPTIQKATFMQNNYSIPVADTNYHHQCLPFSAANGGTITATGKQHMVAIEFIGDPVAGPSNVHHITVQCFKSAPNILWPTTNPLVQSKIPPGYSGTLCAEPAAGPLVWAWAKGFTFLSFPDGTGFPIMGDSGCDYLQLQLHYDNSQLAAGRVDSSGIAIYYTAPRAVEVGVLQIADPSVGLMNRKLSAGFVRESFSCTGLTDLFTDDSVKIFYRGFHMHKLGQRMVTRIYTGSQLVRSDSVEFWNFNLGGIFNPASTGTGFQLRKGDVLQTDCYYHPPNANSVWGLSSTSEMCIDYLYYYPLQKAVGTGQCQLPRQRAGQFQGETCGPTGSNRAGLGGCLAGTRLRGDPLIVQGFASCTSPLSTSIDACSNNTAVLTPTTTARQGGGAGGGRRPTGTTNIILAAAGCLAALFAVGR